MIRNLTPRRTAAAAAGTIVVLSVAYACTQDGPTTSPARASAPRQSSANAADASAAQARQAQVAWVGSIHNEAMEDLVKHKAQWLEGTNDARHRCAAIARLTMKYAPRVEAAAGIVETPDSRARNVNAAVNRIQECRGTASMSVFGAIPMLAATTAATQTSTDASGSFLPYSDQMTQAVNSSDGRNETVEAITASYLNAAIADGVSYGDVMVVEGVRNLAKESASYWNYMEESGQLNPSPPPPPPNETSIFAMQGWRTARILIGSDAIGCAAAVASTWYAATAGPAGLGALLGQCAIWGIGASAAAYLAM